MEIMKEYPDKYFDLAVVDPEYGINEGRRKSYHSNSLTNYTPKIWDKKPADNKYFKEVFRISKNQIIFGYNYFSDKLPICKKPIIWDKQQPEGIDQAMFELIFNSQDDKQAKIYRQSAQSNCNKVANNKHKAQKYIRIHPTQKPVKLYEWIYKNYAKPEFKVIDTHLGSGSNLIAADNYGISEFICCEIDKDYFTDAMNRYKEYKRQLKLF